MTQNTETRCPHCGQVYSVTPQQAAALAGRSIACSECKQMFVFPAATDVAAVPSAGLVPQYATPPDPKRTNGMAIASLVCGLLMCIPFISGVLAIVFGILGLKKTNKDPAVGGQGMSIAGIILGAVGMFMVVPMMIAILLPALSKARETANRASCQNNLGQIAKAAYMYANNNNQQFPARFEDLITDQRLPTKVFVCFSSIDTPAQGAADLSAGGHCSYIWLRPRNTAVSAQVVIAYEPPSNHNNQGANFLYGDGHVSWISAPAAQQVIMQLQSTPAGLE